MSTNNAASTGVLSSKQQEYNVTWHHTQQKLFVAGAPLCRQLDDETTQIRISISMCSYQREKSAECMAISNAHFISWPKRISKEGFNVQTQHAGLPCQTARRRRVSDRKKELRATQAQRYCIIEAPVCDGSTAASVTTDPEVTTTQLFTSAPLPTTAPSPISTWEPTASAEMLTLLPTCTKDPKVSAACDDEPSDLTTKAGCTTEFAPITQ
jgi:hypothetical protein